MGKRVEVKICGLSSAPTLQSALDAGADLVGFVFFAPSPRNLDLEPARRLAAQARGRAEIVALTVDAADEALDGIVAAMAPDWLQLHGRETPARVGAVKARTGRRVIKAVGVSEPADVAAASSYAGIADRVLFDAKPPKEAVLPGGNGRPFDWRMLRGLDLAVPFMLSGGLTLGNVGDALRITGASAVDVSSGVEREPGVKDPGRIRAFIDTVRQASRAARDTVPGDTVHG